MLTGVVWRSLRPSSKNDSAAAANQAKGPPEISAADSKAELESVIAACTAKGLDVLTLTCFNDAANSFGMGFGNLGAVRAGHKLVVRNLRKVRDRHSCSHSRTALSGPTHCPPPNPDPNHRIQDGIAAKAGVRIGDALLGIGGASTPRSQEGTFARLRALPDGKSVELVVAREKEEEDDDDEEEEED